MDYAWDRPSVSGLVAAGKRFAIRYGGPGSDGKQLQAAELAALTNAGIAVVANAEGTATGFRGRSAGIAWAKDALTHFTGLGMPAGRPIYFSADWDVQPSQMDEVDAALRGAAEVIGVGRVGLYGGYAVIRHAQSARTARWFWQTYAWSGGRWAPGTHIQQYRNGVSLAGGTVDLNRAMVSDYGQWGAVTAGMAEGMSDLIGLKHGDRGEQVKGLQYSLIAAGFDPGDPDGVYGDKTAAAVKACCGGPDGRLFVGIHFSRLLVAIAVRNAGGVTSSPAGVDVSAIVAATLTEMARRFGSANA